MGQRIFNTACLLSLVFCLATAGLWARSAARFFQIARMNASHVFWAVRSDKWGIQIERVDGFDPGHTVALFTSGEHLGYRPFFGVQTWPGSAGSHRAPGILWLSGVTDVIYREDGLPVWYPELSKPGVYLSGGPSYRIQSLNLSHALVFWAFGLLPLIWAVQRIRQRRERRARLRNGFCLCCGYWLAGNVSGVCPECGLAVVGETAR
ncbi:MAG TPA: hypothetical protein VIM11_17835 [Tepidisphaeraceae bacterium]